MNAYKFLELVESEAWPDVPIRQEDTELNIFSNYFDASNKARILNLIRDTSNVDIHKDENKANKVRNIGNSLYKSKDYKRALQTYNRSIMYAPRNSEEFGLALANRSAVLYTMELYEDCLQDITNIFKSEYPKNLYYKIFLRQSKCYLKLNLKDKAEESLEKVTNSLQDLKLKHTVQSFIEDEINEVRKEVQTEIKQEPDQFTGYTFLDSNLKDGENPIFLNASNLVELKYNEAKGRHLVAKADISKGDVLIKEEPYAFTITPTPLDIGLSVQKPIETYLKTCATCLRSTASYMPCSVCWKTFYCSTECEQRAVDHRWECVGVQRNILTDQQRICLAILAQATRDAYQTTLDDPHAYGSRINNHPYVNKLLTHKNRIPKGNLRDFVKHSMWMVLYLKHFTEFFDWLYVHPARPDGSREDLYKFIGGQCLKYLLQIEYNAQGIYTSEVQFDKEYIVEVKYVTGAYGIFISSAMLNHSCLSNAIRSFHKTTSIVRASEDIKTGSEITINYLDHTVQNEENEMTKKELKKFMVTCSCRQCADPDYFLSLSPLLCNRCGGKAYLNNIYHISCRDCFLTVNGFEHSQRIRRIQQTVGIAHRTLRKDLLDEIYMLLKQTFSKHTVPYLQYWKLRWFHYMQEKNMKMCYEVCKTMYEIMCVVLKENTIEMQLILTYFSAIYCVQLKEQGSEQYSKYYDETKENIEKSVNLLHLVMGSENIKKYIIHITKIMNSEKIDLDDMLPSSAPAQRVLSIDLPDFVKMSVLASILFNYF